MSETDRQLKDRLNTNQVVRERMCVELLQTQRDFSDVRPRLPKGGPDGGRDLEAVYKDGQRVVGPVGFVNDATDTAEHRRRVESKFDRDLEKLSTIPADDQGRMPEVFVFFTNVGLTPSIVNRLKESAYAANVTLCKVFDRERIRLMLDCNTGYAIRQRHLGIPLSDAEQKDFFDRWGSQIQSMMSTTLGSIETVAHRLHFLAEAQFLVDQIWVTVKLSSSLGDVSGGDFLFQVELALNPHSDGLCSLRFGSGSEAIVESIDEIRNRRKHFPRNGQVGFGFAYILPGTPQHERQKAFERDMDSDEPGDWFAAGSSHGILDIERPYIQTSYGSEPFIERPFPTCRLIDLHRCMIVFLCNGAVASHIEEINVSVNEYRILDLRREELRIDDASPDLSHLPESLGHLAMLRDWKVLRPSDASAFRPAFDTITPERWLRFDN
ncbi:MAG: hypothetical protein OXU64_00635 [Gemmatimonadota bacterium]|nr:hypothetical protein [Gemmatimonadota bacterium]